jgi:hypothetical protein
MNQPDYFLYLKSALIISELFNTFKSFATMKRLFSISLIQIMFSHLFHQLNSFFAGFFKQAESIVKLMRSMTLKPAPICGFFIIRSRNTLHART